MDTQWRGNVCCLKPKGASREREENEERTKNGPFSSYGDNLTIRGVGETSFIQQGDFFPVDFFLPSFSLPSLSLSLF